MNKLLQQQKIDCLNISATFAGHEFKLYETPDQVDFLNNFNIDFKCYFYVDDEVQLPGDNVRRQFSRRRGFISHLWDASCGPG